MDDPYSSPKEDPVGISRKRERTPLRRSIARCSFLLYGLIFPLAMLVGCSCPGFFACMGVCAAVALVTGSRIQRVVAFALLLVAILGFIFELRGEQEMSRRLKRAREVPVQR